MTIRQRKKHFIVCCFFSENKYNIFQILGNYKTLKNADEIVEKQQRCRENPEENLCSQIIFEPPTDLITSFVKNGTEYIRYLKC